MRVDKVHVKVVLWKSLVETTNRGRQIRRTLIHMCIELLKKDNWIIIYYISKRVVTQQGVHLTNSSNTMGHSDP